MGRQAAAVLYVVALVVVVVGVDVLFFRHQFWERLTVNVGIVLVFAAFYFRFLKRPELSRRNAGASARPRRTGRPDRPARAISSNVRSWLPSIALRVKGSGFGRPSSVRRRWSVSTSFVRWGAPR